MYTTQSSMFNKKIILFLKGVSYNMLYMVDKEMEKVNELGNLLRSLREEKSISLRESAYRTGLSHTYISDIEKGVRRGTKTPLNPSPDTLKRLADAYDYPYHRLLQAAGYLDDLDENFDESLNKEMTEDKLQRLINSYTKEERDRVFEILRLMFPDKKGD